MMDLISLRCIVVYIGPNITADCVFPKLNLIGIQLYIKAFMSACVSNVLHF